MASTEPLQAGNCVSAALYQHERGGNSIDTIRHHRLYGWASTLDLEAFDGPRTSLRLAKSLRDYLKTRPGSVDTELDDALCGLVGMHDAWKRFDRVCAQLVSTAPTSLVPLGDVPQQTFTGVLSGSEGEYLQNCGLSPDCQQILADYFRPFWQPIPEANQVEHLQNNATNPPDSPVDGGNVAVAESDSDSGETEGA